MLIDGSLRLYGSGTDDGVLEVYHSGRWGTVCDDGWGTEESLVACRQLGYTTFVSYAHGNTINTDFWLDDVTCIGNESWLVSCSNIGWGVDNCNSGEGIYINCTNGNLNSNISCCPHIFMHVPFMSCNETFRRDYSNLWLVLNLDLNEVQQYSNSSHD